MREKIQTQTQGYVSRFEPLLNIPAFTQKDFPYVHVGPKAYHPSFDDDQLMKLWLLMILCLISDRFIIKILVGA